MDRGTLLIRREAWHAAIPRFKYHFWPTVHLSTPPLYSVVFCFVEFTLLSLT